MVPGSDGRSPASIVGEGPGEGLPLLERALKVWTSRTVSATNVAEAEFALARSLWQAPTTAGRDRPRALELARKADAVYRTAGPGRASEAAAVAAWLADPARAAG